MHNAPYLAMLAALIAVPAGHGIAAPVNQARISADETRAIEADCTRLSISYSHYRDYLRDPVGYANLFTDDGVLILDKTKWVGRDAILKRAQADMNAVPARHLQMSTLVTVQDHDHATGVSYLLSFSAKAPTKQEGAISLLGFRTVGQYFDTYVRTVEGWRIKERRLIYIFSGAGSPHYEQPE